VRQAGKLVLFGLALAGWALLALLATLLCAGWRAGRRQKGR
jgi:disulfide bond formation protein DsbB